jgi:hypothetical protein
VGLTGAKEGRGGAELNSAQGRGEGVAEASVKNEGARVVLFIGARGLEGRQGGEH